MENRNKSQSEKYIFSGRKAERLEPHCSNLISLQMALSMDDQKDASIEKEIVIDIFQLKSVFRYVLQAKHIATVDEFIVLFPTLHFYAKFDREGMLEKAIPAQLTSVGH